jgi:hypothetical protein
MLSNTQCRRFELVSKRHVYKLSNNWLHPDPLISGDLQLLAMIQTALSAVREEIQAHGVGWGGHAGIAPSGRARRPLRSENRNGGVGLGKTPAAERGSNFRQKQFPAEELFPAEAIPSGTFAGTSSSRGGIDVLPS